MDYSRRIGEAVHDAQQLEAIYQAATQTGQVTTFAAAIEACYADDPDNLLYAAWHYRLAAQRTTPPVEQSRNWRVAILLSVACGLILWLLSDEKQYVVHKIPLFVFTAVPISAGFIMLFLSLALRAYPRRLFLLALGLLGFVLYALQAVHWLDTNARQDDYLQIAALHLPLLAWVAVGIYLLWQNGAPDERFAFLIKSLEVIVTGGLFGGAGAVFTAVAFGMFQALDIKLPDLVMRLFFAGGAGLIPVLAVATVYRPDASPLAQSFSQGLGKLIVTINRLLLPLTLLVLMVYIVFIPFNFMQPFHNRDVLIVYNGMLFGVMALLVGATPVRDTDLSLRLGDFLRRTILIVVVLVVLVGLYAMAAILYRTWQGGFTPNRVTVLGWNGINIALLLLLLYKQRKTKPEHWLATLRETLSVGMNMYTAWGIVVVLLLPWFF